jgi:hypothetical protein
MKRRKRTGHGNGHESAQEPHITFLTAGLAAVEREASIRHQGMKQILEQRSTVLMPGQVGALREALGLSIESMRVGQHQFAQAENGRMTVVEDLRHEFEDPDVMVVLIRVPKDVDTNA